MPAIQLIRQKCIGCHTLERVKNHKAGSWPIVVDQMRAYGLKLTDEEARIIVERLESGFPY